ncbi:MAG: hypothetical protein ACRDQF_07390, partial [Thermocrispum sp.]
DLTGLVITSRAKVRAVVGGQDAAGHDEQVALPGVRTRHLPVLAAFSGGRIADPTKEPSEPSDT